MLRIFEEIVDLDLPLGSGIHTLIAQIPNNLKLEGRLYKLQDPKSQFELIRSVLELAADHAESEQIHLILFPESSVPNSHLGQITEIVEEKLPGNTVVIFGLEHIMLSQFAALLEHYMDEENEFIEQFKQDMSMEDVAKPVNSCVTIIKERKGRLRYFFTAKTHPFAGEESVDHISDLYRGKALFLFRCAPVTFNFMPLICFDYVYRDSDHSNIMAIMEKANDLYFQQKQQLDMLAVIQCNPKPEHKVFRDVATGFYGEYLFKSPGVRDAITVFVNSSAETLLEGTKGENTFGHSSIVCGIKHKLPRIKLSEFRTDDFFGSPVSRLRFSSGTRLYFCKLFPHHETDPRSSRAMVKVTGVYLISSENEWERISGDDLLMGIRDDESDSIYFY